LLNAHVSSGLWMAAVKVTAYFVLQEAVVSALKDSKSHSHSHPKLATRASSQMHFCLLPYISRPSHCYSQQSQGERNSHLYQHHSYQCARGQALARSHSRPPRGRTAAWPAGLCPHGTPAHLGS
jgi:hypothetical protein